MCITGVRITILVIVATILLIFPSETIGDRTGIGTCYNIDYHPYPECDEDFLDNTEITSFRLKLSWGSLDYYLSAVCEGDTGCVADSILSNFPDDEDVEKIFLFKFHHPTKMETQSQDTYMYDRTEKDDFLAWCRFIGEVLTDSAYGIKNIALHNEPNVGWNYFAPPGTYGSKRWRNSPGDYVQQCEECIDTIRAYSDSVYIIFGSFCGDSALGFDTTGVVKEMTDSMDLSIVDCIDFHVYKDSVPSPWVGQIADKLIAFAKTNRGKDWSVLETNGPKQIFPVDSTISGKTIYRWLKDYVDTIGPDHWCDNGVEYDSIFIDSLYTLTRMVESCNLLLPENWYENDYCSNYEDYKILEFNRRVPVFHMHGARFVHWFSAWRYDPYLCQDWDEWGCFEDDCTPPSSPTADQITQKLLRRAKWFPRNIMDPQNPSTQTPFAEELEDFILYHEHDDPREGYVGYKAFGAASIDNHPNVFNSRTQIDYVLSSDGNIKLEIYDLLGRKVATLVDEFREAGKYSEEWNAESHPSGVYFCVLTQGLMQVSKKMSLVK
ncbi:MAG: T9SS type A sorting domain-containing protein [candidate division Zixibacteria bacterium]|nr:T9SS type A sorting domain-containing protein [candidate division Zixibacteria bacterium]